MSGPADVMAAALAMQRFAQGFQDQQSIREEIQGKEIANTQALMDLQARKRMMEEFGKGIQGGAKPPQSPAEQMNAIGNAYMRAGLPKQAANMFNTASMLTNREAATSADQAKASLFKIEAMQKHLEQEGQELQGVNDQASFDAFTQRWEQTTGEKAPWEGQPFTPALKDKISERFLTAQQRLKMQADNTKFQALEHYRSAESKLKDAQIRLEEWRNRPQAAKDGKVPYPTKQKVEQVAAQIRQMQPSFDSANADMQTLVATKIAERAQELMQQNRGISYSEAVNKAISEPEAQDDLKSISDAQHAEHWYDRFTGGPAKETPNPAAGTTSANPLPRPTDPKAYVAGKWYLDPKGTPRKYVNGKFYSEEELHGAD